MTPLLQVRNLKKEFPIKKGIFSRTVGSVKAVNDISFSVNEGETFALVGESGCGKSTTGKLLLRLIEPQGGEVLLQNENILTFSKEKMRKARRHMQMVFQDPFASLNPRQTVERILEEPLIVHNIGTAKERKQKVYEMLEIVGLQKEHGKRYPHQFSGGQRQRIGIARALMTNPKLIVADEPVSALDVSIQSQILNLLKDLQKQFQLTYIFISHDLGVVRHISDRVGVMYLGHMVEMADSEKLYAEPLHPYTKALLDAVPIADPNVEREVITIKGELPSPANPPSGCVFHTRCAQCMEICKKAKPEWKEVKPGHYVACHLYS
ncbi:MAG: dipeptide/oligopeptide/nickel ABC transporter ATP-binding protein [Caldibacillus debilis]|uniref:Dipeptide/oligopeptide/nickel ABC transporter ATP-binding protein n=1 Tax=Caldibacillus debilis TaxID=301148 RepID=A0A3E0K5S2_9BACI|nr:dipeptide ABC transporter ATP-binding protein [Caldibacillus debilis]REJ28976.1 MAG: dipeptide/oligopeptide/nickel ABC transporter ATP-binding protein [Caldibacillus debilis]REJ31003.1 MAG: dipeptide/oligopeptide/nickel ABC transporter ATP-binding protein [Caldibacillus debilis]